MKKSKIYLTLIIGIISTQTILEVRSTKYHGKSSQNAQNDGDETYANSDSANYQFQYAVNEGTSGIGNDFGHEEERTGKSTRGRYQVLLPDGRLQVVTYEADENGYRAKVTYEGGESGGGYSTPTKQTKPSNSYGPPPKEQPETSSSGQGYDSAHSASSVSGSFGRKMGSFVKSQRTIAGQKHNYNYSL